MRKSTRRKMTPKSVKDAQQREREKAVAVHAKIAADETNPSYVRARSASAVINAIDRADKGDEPDDDSDAPHNLMVLPWNSRPIWKDSKPILPRFGYTDEPGQRVATIPPGYDAQDPQPEAHYAPFVTEWWRQFEVRLAERTATRLAIYERHLAKGAAPDQIANLLQHNPHDAIFVCVMPAMLPSPEAGK